MRGGGEERGQVVGQEVVAEDVGAEDLAERGFISMAGGFVELGCWGAVAD